MVSQFGGQQFSELKLLALQSKRVGGDVREAGHVEDGSLTRLVNQILPLGYHRSPLDQLISEPRFMEHIQCRRVEGRSAHVSGDGRLTLKHAHGDALVDQPPSQR